MTPDTLPECACAVEPDEPATLEIEVGSADPEDAEWEPERQEQRFKWKEAFGKNGFLRVPIALARKAGPASRSLAGIVAYCEWQNKGQWSTTRSNATLARFCRLPLPTFRRHLKTLKAMKLIKRRQGKLHLNPALKRYFAKGTTNAFVRVSRTWLENDWSWGETILYAYLWHTAFGKFRVSWERDGVHLRVPQRRIAQGTGLETETVVANLERLEESR